MNLIKLFHTGICISSGLLFGFIIYTLLNGEMFSSVSLSEEFKWGVIAINAIFGFTFTYRMAKKSGYFEQSQKVSRLK
jgi:xanthine/uracil/vitamin C permease (AzgA family)